jgi:cytoskeletal protein CcmA (bactofilin family)
VHVSLFAKIRTAYHPIDKIDWHPEEEPLKDVTKIISERATRFLPVDMKDRLKSAFNRNPANTPPTDAHAEEVPDYSAIFNANKVPGSQNRPRFDGPLVAGPDDQAQLAEPPSSVTMRNPARQIAHDIEEAEIVAERHDEPAASPGWEAASLKTRKVEADGEASQEAKTPEIDNDVPDYSAIFKSNKSATVELKAGERKPLFSAEVKPVFKEEAKQVFNEDSRLQPSPEAKSGNNSKHEEVVARKHRSRFFGDFNSTESVRLKVDKRTEERPAAEPIASSSDQRTPQPGQSEPKPAEVKARSAEEHVAAGFAYEAKPLEQSNDAYRGVTEAGAPRPAISEQANINLQKENASMDAKGPESENGATVQTDGNSGVAAIAIERNSKFSGQLKFPGVIAIDGQVEGELVAERIVVHEGGVVNATVEGNTVVIAGTVKGDIYARNELEILPSGVVHGSVTAPAINVRRGGRVEGRCAIGVPHQ